MAVKLHDLGKPSGIGWLLVIIGVGKAISCEGDGRDCEQQNGDTDHRLSSVMGIRSSVMGISLAWIPGVEVSFFFRPIQDTSATANIIPRRGASHKPRRPGMPIQPKARRHDTNQLLGWQCYNWLTRSTLEFGASRCNTFAPESRSSRRS
jgi:hypothetical protein